MEIIAIATQKGGTGKTTTAHALGTGLANRGFRVLLIDLDPQENLTYVLRCPQSSITAYELINGQAKAREAIKNINEGHIAYPANKKLPYSLSIIPSSPMLSQLNPEQYRTGKELRLKEAIEPEKDSFDYIIIDTPPSLGFLTINALAACNSVIVTTLADIFSLQGVGQLIQTISLIKQDFNPDLIIKGLLLTRYNNRSIVSRDLTELIEDTARKVGTFVYKTAIRDCTAIREAQASRQDIFSYSPRSNAAIDYQNFIDEFINIKELESNG